VFEFAAAQLINGFVIITGDLFNDGLLDRYFFSRRVLAIDDVNRLASGHLGNFLHCNWHQLVDQFLGRPEDQYDYDITAASLASELGEDGYRQAFEAGKLLTLEQAVEMAQARGSAGG
jgi:hypothetical protein